MAIGFPVKDDYVTGDVLTAANMNDLSGTLNTIQSVEYAAGKNKIINGDMRFNQRGFTSVTTNGFYNFDRFCQINGGTTGTLTTTPQTFTPGAAPVAGYEARNFVQCVTASGASTDTYAMFVQKIESVRTLAGSTATISFWAKAASGTPKIGVELEQIFGTGGSPSAPVNTSAGSVTLSTSWARYSVTIAVPSISGKTIGTAGDDILNIYLWLSAGSTFASRASSIGLQNATFSIWGLQVEQGSTASDFQTATGTLQGELAACQRYYEFIGGKASGYPIIGGYATAGISAYFPIAFKVSKRISPTVTKVGTWAVGNTGQPSPNYIGVDGFSSLQTATASGAFFTYPDSTDDGFTVDAEL